MRKKGNNNVPKNLRNCNWDVDFNHQNYGNEAEKRAVVSACADHRCFEYWVWLQMADAQEPQRSRPSECVKTVDLLCCSGTGSDRT